MCASMDEKIVYDAEYFKAQGRLGGIAARERLTPKQRRRAAKKAARARWDRTT